MRRKKIGAHSQTKTLADGPDWRRERSRKVINQRQGYDGLMVKRQVREAKIMTGRKVREAKKS